MYQTAVHRGERKFAPVERVEQPEVSKEEGREGARTSKDPGGVQETISSSNTMTTLTMTLIVLQWRKMVPFVICRARNSVNYCFFPQHRKK